MQLRPGRRPAPPAGVPGRTSSVRGHLPLATAAAALALTAVVVGANATPGLGLTPVAAQPKAAGVATPNILSPELIETELARGSWRLENPSADGVIAFYGYWNDGRQMVPIPPNTTESQKTEPDKNTYLVLKGQQGADALYDYGTHFLFQGHEIGGAARRGYITRINLDADPAHRITLLASTQQATANLPAGNLPVYDGSVWNPFTQTLLFSDEGNGSSSGGIWEATPNYPSTVVDRIGIFGRAGYEGIQADSDGNIWLVEDIGAAGAQTFSGAKQANSFIYRFIPKNRADLSAGGRLQVLQADGRNGQPVTFGAPAASLGDVNTTFMKDLHTYGNSFATRWITIHDTATDGFGTFNANALAKSLGGTAFKRPENGNFRPGSKFTEFFFTETGDTNASSAANGAPGVGYGGWGGILRLVQKDPSASTGTLSPFFLGDITTTGLDNLTFLDRDNVIAVEDAGDGLHTSRALLDSAYVFPIARDGTSGTPVRFLGEGRDDAATVDAAIGGSNGNDGDNEITGAHISDGDPTVKGLIGTKDPQFLAPDGRAHDGWRFFWTQQHGDNVTYEVLNAPHP